MAETESASKRPFWVTLVAAIATVTVVVALAAGPTLSGCATSAEGFSGCMRQKLADIGLLPKSPSPVEAPQKVADQEMDTAAEEPASTDMQVATIEEEPAVEDSPAPAAEDMSAAEPEQAAPEPDAPMPPLLGLVRVEPDGSVVIAGSAEPGSEVEIYANGALLGSTTAETSGDWVFVPDQPLPPGSAEITVAVPALGLTADRSVVVVVQEDRTTEPLVVASTPGEASEVLQGVDDTSAAAPEAPVSEPVAEETPMEVAEAAPAAQPEAPASSPEPDMAEAKPEMAEAPVAATEPAQTEVADVQPEQVPAMEEPSEPAATMVPPSIDAVEIDGDRNFFAGGGEEGATIRLYVNDGFIADAIVNDGRWLIETARNVLTDVSQRVRVDMLKPDSSDVVGRAEVNFEIVLPEVPATDEPTSPSIVVADKPADAPMVEGAEDAATDAAAMAEPPAVAAEPETSEPAQPEQPTEVAEAKPVMEPKPAGAPQRPAKAIEPAPVEDAQQASAPEADSEASPAMEPAAEPEMDEDVPTITAVQVGEGDEQRFAAGHAIIRRGDNLWTIARRVYGEGVRYTTIYQANRGQIRNPDLIYPGQVFALPEGAE